MPVVPSGTLQGPPDQELNPYEPRLERPISRRFFLFKGGLLAAFGVLAVRLWQMQIAEGRQYAALAERNRVDARPVPAPRGVIYDRNGIVLAGNKANWNVTIVPANLPEDEAARRAVFAELNQRLAPPWVLAILPLRLPSYAEADVYQRVAVALNRPVDDIHTTVTTAVEADQVPIIEDDLPADRAPALEQALAGLPGILLMSRPEYLVWSNAQDARLSIVVHQGIPRDLALSIESRSLLMPGVGIQPEPGRSYPSGTIAAHVVGYVGRVDEETQKQALTPSGQPIYDLTDNIGRAGMEAVLEPVLRGRKGFHIVEVDINRRIVRELSNQPPLPGSSAALTIDLGLQKEASDALNMALARAGASAGAVIAIEPTTGEVLSLVSLPTFNSQGFSDGMSAREYQALLNDPNLPLFNRAVGGVYAPSDCIKPFVALAALRAGVVQADTLHVCKGGVYVPADFNEITRTLYRCWQPGGHGPLSVTGGLAHACHVFFYNLVVPAIPDSRGKNLRYYEAEIGGTPIEFKGLGIERIKEMALAFGFGRQTGIELEAEAEGLLPDPEWKRNLGDRGAWTVADTIINGIGQRDVRVTPLQLAVATAAVANGGTVYRPRVLKSVLREGNTVIEEQQPVVAGKLEVSPEHIDLIRQGMKAALQVGVVAERINVPGVEVAGITSTIMPQTAEDQDQPRSHAWFAGFAPADQPRIALAVLLERAGAGADAAAPVAERVLRAFFRV